MGISGGGPKIDILSAEYEDRKQDRLDRHEDSQKRKMDRQRNNLKRLLSEEWGRELLWNVLIDADSLKINPYTRNADTYYILGLQRQAKLCTEVLKELDFENYQKMEKEARNRIKREEEE